VITFEMTMVDELSQRSAQMPFADQNESIEAFLFQRPHEALHLPSRSQITTCGDGKTSSSAIVSVRATCPMNTASGWAWNQGS